VPPALPELSRRAFLSRSLRAAGVLAAVPGLAPACAPAPARPAPAGLLVLRPGEWAVLDAAADALIPRGGAFALGAADVDLAARADRFLAAQSPELVGGLRGALLLLEWGGGLLAGRPGRFSRLSPEDRAAVMAALPRRFGLARQVFAGLKQLCGLLFYADPRSWPALGYDGPWV
jgi:hypothetical protein